jgi:hypothetical protein
VAMFCDRKLFKSPCNKIKSATFPSCIIGVQKFGDYYLLGCDTIQSGRLLPTLQSNMLSILFCPPMLNFITTISLHYFSPLPSTYAL